MTAGPAPFPTRRASPAGARASATTSAGDATNATDGHVLPNAAEEYLTWLAVDRGRSRNTVAAYRRDLTAFDRFARSQGHTILDAGPDLVDRYLDQRLRQGTSPASTARALAAIRGMYRFATDELGACHDPTALVRPIRLAPRLPKALGEATVLQLLDSIPSASPADLRDRAVIETLYGTGMRVGELVGLRLSDLGSETGLVRVLGKGNRERLVPLGGCAAEAMARWLGPAGRPRLEPARWARAADADAVFLNQRGRPITRQGIWAILTHRAQAAGIAEALHPHALRHSCATHMLAHGADVRVVQELLGHASVATTQIYTNVSTEHLRQAYEAAHPRAGTPLQR